MSVNQLNSYLNQDWNFTIPQPPNSALTAKQWNKLDFPKKIGEAAHFLKKLHAEPDHSDVIRVVNCIWRTIQFLSRDIEIIETSLVAINLPTTSKTIQKSRVIEIKGPTAENLLSLSGDMLELLKRNTPTLDLEKIQDGVSFTQAIEAHYFDFKQPETATSDGLRPLIWNPKLLEKWKGPIIGRTQQAAFLDSLQGFSPKPNFPKVKRELDQILTDTYFYVKSHALRERYLETIKKRDVRILKLRHNNLKKLRKLLTACTHLETFKISKQFTIFDPKGELPLPLFTLRHLKSVRLYNVSTPVEWDKLPPLSALNKLSQARLDLTSGLVKTWARLFPKLKILELYDLDRIEKNAFREFHRLGALKTLNFSNQNHLYDDSIEVLCRQAPNLKKLTLNNCPGLTKTTLVYLKGLKKLEFLSCKNSFFEIELFKFVKTAFEIKNLNLDFKNCSSPPPLHDLVNFLNSRPLLKELNLYELKFFSIEMAISIARLANLRVLTINSNRVTDVHLQAFVAHIQPKAMNLAHCQQLTSLGLETLKHNRQLRHLNVSYTSIFNSDLKWILKNNRQLKSLDLSNCKNIASAGFSALFSLFLDLKKLDLSGLEQLSYRDIKKCKKLMKLEYLNIKGVRVSEEQKTKFLAKLQKRDRLIRVIV